MQYLRVGHYTDATTSTGATVFLFERPAVAAFHLGGASPATVELGVLALDAQVTHINGLVFTGGSAMGLAAVGGVMQWLEEQKRGWPVPHGCVPIVPAAAIYDFGMGKPAYPRAEHLYQACVSAEAHSTIQGRVGAGTGASVGKLVPHAKPMPGGLGIATALLPDGVTVKVYAIVNSVGDVYDAAGNILAGAQTDDHQFVNCQHFLHSGQSPNMFSSSNTTLIAVFTDGVFDKAALSRISKMAVAGMARAIAPVFTQYDGDIVFAVSLGDLKTSELAVGSLAAELTRLAIINAF